MITSKCINCDKCQKNCAFLQIYEQNVAELYETINSDLPNKKELPFHCFLCGKCSEICPVGIDGKNLMQDLRNKLNLLGEAPFPQHKGIIKDKGQYFPKLYRKNSNKTLFFPGCHLIMYLPDVVSKLVTIFKDASLALDCCGKPIHELGMADKANNMRKDLLIRFNEIGAKQIVTACPNCYYYFKNHLDINVITVYQYLKEIGFIYKGPKIKLPIHISCPDRIDKIFLKDIKEISDGKISFEYLSAQCCGWGGGVGIIHKDLETRAKQPLVKLNNKEDIMTYCSGCLGSLSRSGVNAQHALRILLGTDTHNPGEKNGAIGFLNRFKIFGKHFF